MHEDGKKLLELMFRPEESLCVSHNEYGYHSIPLSFVLSSEVTLVSPDPDRQFEIISSDILQLVALNPINGFRRDSGCYYFRNFLIEMDYGSIESQMEYAHSIGLPYSAAIFSGNKSVHFLVSLSTDLSGEAEYRKLAEWSLAIASMADPNTKNPSRSIRIPGAARGPGKVQKLLDYRGSTSIDAFMGWLRAHPGCEPKEREKRERSETPDINKVSMWVQHALVNGLDPLKGRNRQWFAIACDFALSGFSEDDTLDLLSNYFVSDRDFTEREWKTTVCSAFKYIYDRGR